MADWEDRILKLGELRKEITSMRKEIVKPISKMKRSDLLDHYKQLKGMNLPGPASPAKPVKKGKKAIVAPDSESESEFSEPAPVKKSSKKMVKEVVVVKKKSKKAVVESDSE